MAENGKKLVVVESPAKAKTINKILGKQYSVTASVGHIIDLPKTQFGVDLENGFKPQYTVIKGKNKIIKELKDAAAKSAEVYLATDPDREGEAIAYHIANSLKSVNPNIQRIEFQEITASAIKKALEKPRDIDEGRVFAQQARRVMDRIVGYQVSPFLWKTIYRGLSAGRVQSVALRLLCEREDEIARFEPIEFWTAEARFETPNQKYYLGKLHAISGNVLDPKKFRIGTEAEARQHEEAIRKAVFTIRDVEKKKLKRKSPPPFITSTLQQVASRQLRMSTSRVMSIAQQLYEGIDLGEKGTVGLITYMRTDSTRISEEAIEKVRPYIAETYGAEYVPAKPNRFAKGKSAQDAHEAIRPTYLDAAFEPKRIKKYLTPDQFKLYNLIWKRFVACQMSPAVVDKTIVTTVGDVYEFRTEGEIIVFKGYLLAYQESDEENGDDAENVKKVDSIPAELEAGLTVNLDDLSIEQKFTQPPPRFTESTLVKMLEKEGIGRPSTYAQIISTLIQRKYVEKKERTLVPTDLGQTVNKLLVQNFPDIFNVKFTKKMEDSLDKIEQQQAEYEEILNSFYKPFSKAMESVTARQQEIKEGLKEESELTCDLCGKPMVLRWGRNGRFYACSGYPECKNTKPLEEPEPDKPTSEICDKCQAPMVIKKGRYGEFLACSRYPECKNTRPMGTGVKCPEDECGGELVQRRSRRGKAFYSCSNYPKCKYAIWDKPVNFPCPECGHDFMVEKYSKVNGYYLACPNCKFKKTDGDQ
ncbi:MAG: type I DNA topoisomerase [Calditrichia bacterium]